MRELESTCPQLWRVRQGPEGCSSDFSALLLHLAVLREELCVKATDSSWPQWHVGGQGEQVGALGCRQ